MIDPWNDRVLAADEAAAATLGTDEARLRGLHASALFEGQRVALVVFTQAVQAQKIAVTRTLRPRHVTGHFVAVEITGRLVRDTPHSPLAFDILVLDEPAAAVTDTDGRGERLFADIERHNQLILGAAGEGIYGVNIEGRTTFVNPAGAAMLGYTQEELLGRAMHATVHHHHPDGSRYADLDCPIYAAFREGAVKHVTDEVFWRKDGTPFWVEYTSTPIRDDGILVGAVIVFRDVTERHENEAKLRSALAEVDRLRGRLELENTYLKEEIRIETNPAGIVGKSLAVRNLVKQIDIVAPSDATILITGESGTGKDLVARAIHDASARRDRPLVRVNCAAIPGELFESEFFGHVKGAFTGALRDSIGRFELADRGTLFLDEIGEIPVDLQSKLLRVLQEGQFERVGEERTRSVDVRIVAATNRDLRSQVRLGRFREDLYFRLAVVPIESVPLRERRDDIALLAMHFLRNERKSFGKTFTLTEGDVRRLTAYDWPGNVRELQNVIERAMILARNGRLAIDLPEPGIATAAIVSLGECCVGCHRDRRGAPGSATAATSSPRCRPAAARYRDRAARRRSSASSRRRSPPA